MSLSEDFHSHSDLDEPDATAQRAAALVNPVSGLANDFLNVYNEILMLIEMLPGMPDLADDILAWRPCSYRAYFMQSQLPGRREALDAYAKLDSSFRALFEASVEQLAECGDGAIREIASLLALGASDRDEQVGVVCGEWGLRIRQQLGATEQLVNFGRVACHRDPQDVVNELFSAA